MSSGDPHRGHPAQFKLQVCQEIRSGALGRKEAQRKYTLSANLRRRARIYVLPD